MAGIREKICGLYTKLDMNNSIIRNKLLQVLANKEDAETSYLYHNSEYAQKSAIDRERKAHEELDRKGGAIFNDPILKFRDLIEEHPEVRSLAVDIGCGTGYFSKKMSEYFEGVVGIEPSAAAIEIAKALAPKEKYPKIQWRVGFAEDRLKEIRQEKPIAFFTSTVLSHIPDDAVAKICKEVNAAAPVGSILAFGECWGKEAHKYTWHIRTKEWWQEQLPGWELDFFGPEIQNVKGRNKGFHGVKKK